MADSTFVQNLNSRCQPDALDACFIFHLQKAQQLLDEKWKPKEKETLMFDEKIKNTLKKQSNIGLYIFIYNTNCNSFSCKLKLYKRVLPLAFSQRRQLKTQLEEKREL